MVSGVQEVLDRVIERVVDLVDGGGGTGSASSGDPAARVEARLLDVRASCTRAMLMDDVEAAAHWAAMAALGPLTAAMMGARIAFDGSVGALKGTLREHVAALDLFTNNRIISQRGALEGLRADEKHWRGLSSRVAEVRSVASGLRTIPGWSGESANEYAAVVEVQTAALEDLSLFLRQVQNSCARGITLNRHAFIEVEQKLAHVSKAIPGAGGGGGSFYRRTADAISRLRPLLGEIDPRSLAAWSAGNAAANVSGRAMTSMETLDPHYWPTGSSGSGIPLPAIG